jgi:hypothetical protein
MSGVSIGSLEGSIVLKDEFTQIIAKFESKLKSIEDTITKTTNKNKSETDKIKSAYDKLAASLDPVIARQQKYERSVETLTSALKAGIISQSQFNSTLQKAESRLQSAEHWTTRLGSSIGSSLVGQFAGFLTVAGAATLVTGLFVKVSKQLVEVTIEKEKTERQLEAAIKRSAAASDISSEFAIQLADSLSRLTGVDDDAIVGAEAVALRYNRISAKIFPDVTKAALDLAAATGKDLPSAMEFAAKMVNNPLRALTLLNREGYAVGASQSDLIKHLLASNDILGAQGVILKILQDRYGDTAEEMRNTMGGAITALSTSWENLLEELGKDSTGPIREGLEKLITLLDTLTDHVDDFSNGWVIAWSNATIAVDSFMIGVTKMQIGAAEGPLARLLNPAGAARAAEIARKGLADLENDLSDASQSLANVYMKMAGFGNVSSDAHGKGTKGAFEQTDAERQLAEAINNEISKLREQISFNKLLTADYRAGGKAVADDTRAHELRKIQLEAESKYGPKLAAQIVALNSALLKSADALTREKTLYEDKIHALKVVSEWQIKIGKEIDELARKSAQQLHLAIRQDELDAAKRSLSISESLRTNEEERLDAIKEAVGLYNTIITELIQIKTLSGEIVTLKPGDRALSQQDFEAVLRVNANPLFDAAQQELYDFAGQVVSTFSTIAGESQAYEARIIHAVEEGFLTVEQGERALWENRQENISRALDDWNTFFNFLGEAFGGVFAKISSYINQIQSAYSQGRSIGGALGGSQGASYGGYVGAIIGIWTAAYQWFTNKTKQDKARSYDYGVVSTFSKGKFDDQGLTGKSLEATRQIQATINAIVESLGGIIKSFADIEVQIRRDGKYFRAYVQGVFIGQFEDMNEAVSAALAAAFHSQSTVIAGLSAEFRQILSREYKSVEQLQSDLATAATVRNARVGEAGTQYIELTNQRNSEIDAAQRAGLAIGDLIAARDREQQALINSALGIDTSSADRLRALQSLSTGMGEAADSTRAHIQAMVEAIQAQIATLTRAGTSETPGGTGGFGGPGGPAQHTGQLTEEQSAMDAELARLQAQLDDYISQLDRIPQALSDQQINMGIFDTLYHYLEGDKKYAKQAHEYARMKVEAEFEALRLQLVAMGKWEEFAGMWNDAFQAAKETADKGSQRRGGGGHAEARESALAQLEQLRAQAIGSATEAVQQNHAALVDWNQAAKEGKLTTAQRTEGERLLREQLARTLAEQSKQLSLSIADFQGISDPFAQIETQADKLRHDLMDLANATGMSVDQINAALNDINSGIAYQKQRAVFGIFDQIYSYLKDAPEYAAQILAFKRKELDVQFKIFETQLRAMNMWDEASAKILADAHKAGDALLEGATAIANSPNSQPGGTGGSDGYWVWMGGEWQWIPLSNGTPGEIDNSLTRAQDLLKQYQNEAEDELTQALNKINSDFQIITSALGNTAEVIQARNQAIANALDKFMDPVRRAREGFDFSSTSTLTGEQQFFDIQAQFRDLMAGGLDLKDRDKLLELANLYRDIGSRYTAGEGFRFIDKEIKDALDQFLALGGNLTTDSLGTVNNPMTVESPQLIATVNQGNVLILQELRAQLAEQQLQNARLQQIIDNTSSTSYTSGRHIA